MSDTGLMSDVLALSPRLSVVRAGVDSMLRGLLARMTHLAPDEASHEPQIGAGLLLAELPQRLPACRVVSR